MIYNKASQNNSLMQADLADLEMKIMLRILNTKKYPIIKSIHDSIVVEVPVEEIESYIKEIK